MRASLFILLLLPAVAAAQLLEPQPQDPLRADAQEYGVPLPPTAAEVKALTAEERAAQASAMKRVLVLQHLQFVADGYRMTAGNEMACAYLAAKLGASRAFVQMLHARAAGGMSTMQHRILNKAFDRTLELYQVDSVAIRFFVESDLAAPELISDMLTELPLQSLFNLVDPNALTIEQALADADEVAKVFTELTTLYASVTNAEQAAAVVPQVQVLVGRFGKVYPGLALAPEPIRKQLMEAFPVDMNPILSALRENRRRLQQENFYGNPRLKVLDYFFE